MKLFEEHGLDFKGNTLLVLQQRYLKRTSPIRYHTGGWIQ